MMSFGEATENLLYIIGLIVGLVSSIFVTVMRFISAGHKQSIERVDKDIKSVATGQMEVIADQKEMKAMMISMLKEFHDFTKKQSERDSGQDSVLAFMRGRLTSLMDDPGSGAVKALKARAEGLSGVEDVARVKPPTKRKEKKPRRKTLASAKSKNSESRPE